VRRILTPAAWNTASNEAVKFDPRSRSRNLMSSNRSPRARARLRACCTVHSPVGLSVNAAEVLRRVPCSMNTRTYSCGTTRRAMNRWLVRSVRRATPDSPGTARANRSITDGWNTTPGTSSRPGDAA
jgi:hypothetical protein